MSTTFFYEVRPLSQTVACLSAKTVWQTVLRHLILSDYRIKVQSLATETRMRFVATSVEAKIISFATFIIFGKPLFLSIDV